VTTDYVNPAGTLALRIGTTSAAVGTNFVTCCTLFSAGSVFGPVGPILNLSARSVLADIVDAPIQLAKTTSDLTLGDGTIQVKIRYLVVDF
jgi:hypothetical protein